MSEKERQAYEKSRRVAAQIVKQRRVRQGKGLTGTEYRRDIDWEAARLEERYLRRLNGDSRELTVWKIFMQLMVTSFGIFGLYVALRELQGLASVFGTLAVLAFCTILIIIVRSQHR